MVINKDDGTGEAQAFAEAVGIPVLAAIPAARRHPAQERELRDHRPPGGEWGTAVRGAGHQRRRGAAGACRRTARARRNCWAVRRRRSRPRRAAAAGDLRRHVRRRRARSRCRWKLFTTTSEPRDASPRRSNDTSGCQDDGRSAGCQRPGLSRRLQRWPLKKLRCGVTPARASVTGAIRERLSEGPARSAAEHVPGVRIAARRAAHAPHRDGAVRFRLLRVRPDLHLAFLRRAAHGRLRTVQFRDAGHRQALRGHPRRGPQAGRPGEIRLRSSLPTCACRPRPACRCSCCPKKSTACASSASTCPAFGVPTHAEAKDVLAGAMLRYAREEAESGPVQAPREGE